VRAEYNAGMTHQELRRRLWLRWFPHLSREIMAISRSNGEQWSWLFGTHRRPPRYAGPLPDRRRRLYDPRRQRH
jgi:hypothetical protein